MKKLKNRFKLSKVPYIILIAGLTAISADLIYTAVYAYSLAPDVLCAEADRIGRMLEYIFASLTVLVGGVLLFDYAIKERDDE